MNTKSAPTPLKQAALWLLAVLAFTITPLTFAQGTAFTYQGRLNDSASPAIGSYDLTFALFDAASGGTQQGNAITNSATSVSNGLFTVTLDFGNQFTGANRWLEIGVRTNAGGTFTTLVPRQPITSTPYAVHAGNAVNASSVAAANINGTISFAQLPTSLVTNGANGVNFSGSFSGSGAGLTNVARLNGNQTFTGVNTFSNTVLISAANYLEFGAGVAGKEGNAGRIGYGTFTSDALDIVGAGTNWPVRKIKFWAEGGASFAGDVLTSASFKGNGAMPWQTVNGTSVEATANSGYAANAASEVSVSVPATANIGDIIEVSGLGAGGWNIDWPLGATWEERGTAETYKSVACSADGSRIIAVEAVGAIGGGVFVSTDGGTNFAGYSASPNNVGWWDVACSADGLKVIGSANNNLWASTNGGVTWVVRTNLPSAARGVASSADGNTLVAGSYSWLYTSSDGGSNWTLRLSGGTNYWYGVASSADGSKLVAAPYNGQIYTSANRGTNWVARESNRPWTAIASSSDGSKLFAAASSGNAIYVSTDGGTNWLPRATAQALGWQDIACSSDGSKLLAVDYGGQIYISSDGGTNWDARFEEAAWNKVACSADFGKLVAIRTFSDRIYVSDYPTSVLSGEQGSTVRLQYVGNGVWQPLNKVNVANITGTIPLAQLPTSIVTNNASGVNFSGRFNGNAGGMTNVQLGSLVDHGVVVWGDNEAGQTNVPLAARSGVAAIAAGDFHTLALKSDGSVLAWGLFTAGQTNVPVAARSGVVAIAAGIAHSVALKTDGSVLAWGNNNFGQTNVPVAAQSGVVAIAAAGGHTVALKTNGSVLAWGVNNVGQINVPVAAQSGVVAIAAGRDNTVALKTNGSVLVWGDNGPGQTTVPVAAQSGVVAIAAGASHIVALKNNGAVLAWGLNNFGQTNVPAAAQSGVRAIAASFGHTVALKTNGSVVAWGNNNNGQTNVPPIAQSGVTAIAAGEDHNVVLISKIAFHPDAGLSFGFAVSATTFTGSGANLTSLNAGNISSGTLADARLSTNVSLLGQSIESAEITDGTIVNADISNSANIADTKLSSNVARRSEANAFTGNQTVTGGNVGIGTTTPDFPLSFPNSLGDKISLYGSSGNHYGFGIQGAQLQIHTASSSDSVVFGHGQSTNLTETMRVLGTGNVGIGTANPANKLQVGNQFFPASGYGLQVNSAAFGADIQITNSGGICLFLHNAAGGNPNMLLIKNGPGETNIFNVTGNGAVSAAGTVTALSFNPTSDRNVKENFSAVDVQEVLAKVTVLPISRWNFKTDAATKHLGPMAQDFRAAFGLGPDDKHIATVDADGVALAAIQGLNEKLEARSQKLEKENAELRNALVELKSLVKSMNEKLNRGGK